MLPSSTWMLGIALSVAKSQISQFNISEPPSRSTLRDEQGFGTWAAARDREEHPFELSAPRNKKEREAQVEDEQPCWFVMFLHVAKTGGTLDFASLGMKPTRKFHVMQKPQLVEMTTGPLPDPREPANRRLAVEIHGHVHREFVCY